MYLWEVVRRQFLHVRSRWPERLNPTLRVSDPGPDPDPGAPAAGKIASPANPPHSGADPRPRTRCARMIRTFVHVCSQILNVILSLPGAPCSVSQYEQSCTATRHVTLRPQKRSCLPLTLPRRTTNAVAGAAYRAVNKSCWACGCAGCRESREAVALCRSGQGLGSQVSL